MKEDGKLTLASLFDGSGGFPLGAIIAGIEPVWASEIELFPLRVTRRRMPFVRHLGDIRNIKGDEAEPVDIITFGSPCQDLSVAGRREGLEGSRSSLFFEAVRIIREMREKTNGEYPRYIIWENVPGALSSSGGEDFRAVLEEIISLVMPRVHIPKPERWKGAGLILEDHFSLAWRILDAQYWGVPQRRKRIYLVADLGGEGAGEILFKSEGVPGYTPSLFRTWQGSAGGTEGSTGETGTLCLNDQGGERMDVSLDRTSTLRAEANHPPLVFENHGKDARYKGPIEKSETITANYGTGGNNQPLVVGSPKTLKIRSGHGSGGRGALIQDDLSATLSCNGGEQTLFQPACFRILSFESGSMKSPNPDVGINKTEVSPTLDSQGTNPACNQGGLMIVGKEDVKPISLSKSNYMLRANEDVAAALVATDYKDPPIVGREEKETGYLVRRLMPLECARLQGFPDWWCSGLSDDNPSEEEMSFWRNAFEEYRHAAGKKGRPKTDKQIRAWLASPHSDAAEYRMWGNGVALPCIVYLMAGIRRWAEDEAERGVRE